VTNIKLCDATLLRFISEVRGPTHRRLQASRDDAVGSVVIADVIALHEPIAASAGNIFLVKTTSFIAKSKYWLPIAVQMFEVQLHKARIVEIGRKVVTSARRISAHADDSIPNLGRQTFDMFRIPGIVVANLAAASECEWMIAEG
jgi:hypothetical protein